MRGGGQGKETALAHFETFLLLVAKGNNSEAEPVYPPADVGIIIARLYPPPRTWYLIAMSEMNYTLLTSATRDVGKCGDARI